MMDDWPEYLLVDAKILRPGTDKLLVVIAKKQIQNVAIFGATDKGKKPLQETTVKRALYYSIGANPATIWLGSDQEKNWYSITSPAKDHTMWGSQLKAINIFFETVVFFEEDPSRISLPLIDQVIQISTQVSNESESAWDHQDFLQACRENAKFLTYHMGVTAPTHLADDDQTQIDLRDTMIYKWINGGCAENDLTTGNFDNDLTSGNISFPIPNEIAIPVNQRSWIDDATPTAHMTDSDESMASADESTMAPGPSTSKPVGPSTSKGVGPPHKGEYVSPQRPLGTPMPETFVDVALAVIFHFIASGRDGKTLATLSLGNVNGALYKDFNFKRPEVATRMLQDRAMTIYNLLPPNFQNALIGQELHKAKPKFGKIVCIEGQEKANEQYRGLYSGTETLKQRGSSGHGTRARAPRGSTTQGRASRARASQGRDSASQGYGVGTLPAPGSVTPADEGDEDGEVAGRDVARKAGAVLGEDFPLPNYPGFIDGKPIPKPIKRSGYFMSDWRGFN